MRTVQKEPTEGMLRAQTGTVAMVDTAARGGADPVAMAEMGLVPRRAVIPLRRGRRAAMAEMEAQPMEEMGRKPATAETVCHNSASAVTVAPAELGVRQILVTAGTLVTAGPRPAVLGPPVQPVLWRAQRAELAEAKALAAHPVELMVMQALTEARLQAIRATGGSEARPAPSGVRMARCSLGACAIDRPVCKSGPSRGHLVLGAPGSRGQVCPCARGCAPICGAGS